MCYVSDGAQADKLPNPKISKNQYIRRYRDNSGRSKHSASDLHATCCREQGLETDNCRDAASFEIKFASNETSRLARTTLELRRCKQAMRAATMTITETSWDAVTIARDNGQVANRARAFLRLSVSSSLIIAFPDHPS